MVEAKVHGNNHKFAKILVDSLVQLGATTFVLSPGGRSAPLALALSEREDINLQVHADERGAAFFAIGAAKASGKPTVLVCTSGSAVANYLPAIVEACYAELPLIILTADRPLKFFGRGANQTIDQRGIFSNFTCWDHDFEEAEANPEAIINIATKAYAEASTSPRGPVHLNCRFHRPIFTDSTDSNMPESLATELSKALPTESAKLPVTDAKALRSLVVNSKKTVIIVGELPTAFPSKDFLQISKIPMLADVLSNLRSLKNSSNLFSHYSLYLASEKMRKELKPDLIVHIGGRLVGEASGTSPLFAYIEESEATHVVINSSPSLYDPLGTVDIQLHSDISEALRIINESSLQASPLLEKIATCEEKTQSVISKADPSMKEWRVVSQVTESLPANSALFSSSSFVVRELDAVTGALADNIFVACNRGASGIDGNIASAIGFAQASKRDTTLLIGDLAFLHDLNSLYLARYLQTPFRIVLLNNNGGAIFKMLPEQKFIPKFNELFTAEHGLKFKASAEQFGFNYSSPSSTKELESALTSKAENPTLIEVFTSDATEALKELSSKVTEAIWP